MLPPPPITTRTDTLFPYPTLCRAPADLHALEGRDSGRPGHRIHRPYTERSGEGQERRERPGVGIRDCLSGPRQGHAAIRTDPRRCVPTAYEGRAEGGLFLPAIGPRWIVVRGRHSVIAKHPG